MRQEIGPRVLRDSGLVLVVVICTGRRVVRAAYSSSSDNYMFTVCRKSQDDDLTPTVVVSDVDNSRKLLLGHSVRMPSIVTGLVLEENTSGRGPSSDSSINSSSSSAVPLQYRHSHRWHRLRATDSRLLYGQTFLELTDRR